MNKDIEKKMNDYRRQYNRLGKKIDRHTAIIKNIQQERSQLPRN